MSLIALFTVLGFHQMTQTLGLLSLSEHLNDHHHHVHVQKSSLQTSVHVHHGHSRKSDPGHAQQWLTEWPDLFLPSTPLFMGLFLLLFALLIFRNANIFRLLNRQIQYRRIRPPPLLGQNASLQQLKTIILLH